MGTGMRQDKIRLVKTHPTKVNQVYVYRTRTVPDRPYPTECILYRVHAHRKVMNLKPCLEYCKLVQELHV